MKDLGWLVELNERAVDRCSKCATPRHYLDARKSYLALYEIFNAESEAEALLCRECANELADCGSGIARVKVSG